MKKLPRYLLILFLTVGISGESSSYADLSSQMGHCFSAMTLCSAYAGSLTPASNCWIQAVSTFMVGSSSQTNFDVMYGSQGNLPTLFDDEGCSASFATGGGPTTSAAPPPKSACLGGSIIHVDNQAVGERVPVVGAPFDLVYFSDRVPGRVQAYTATIPYFLNGVVQFAGQTVALSPSSDIYTWDGLDGTGNPVQGTITANVGEDIIQGGGCFLNSNPAVSVFDCEGPNCSSLVTCAYDQYTQTFTFTLGMYRSDLLGLGGWAPSILHFYDVNTNTLYTGDGLSRHVVAHLYGGGTQYIVGSSDESELYVFSSAGNHLYTLNGQTGSTLYTFGYDSNNRLSTITDAYSNVTTVLRNNSGSLVGIQAPYGQTTSFTLDSNGYLASISNPNNETYSMTSYGTGGLMQTFTKPAGQVSTFVYDSNGLLTSDSSSTGSSTALALSGLNTAYPSITATSALGLNTQYDMSLGGAYQRTQNDPDSSQSSYYFFENAVHTVEYSTISGTTYYSNTVPDPRLGAISNFLYELALEPGSSEWYSLAYRSIPGWTQSSDPNNPTYFNYSTIDTSVAVNGASASWNEVYTLSTGTTVTTSPVGRVTTSVTDTYGKPTSVQKASFTPITFGYDSNGRVIQINQGSARQSTISYYPSGAQAGWIESVTDAMSETTHYTYDRAGRVLTETSPDSRVITYTYDADGNVASVTPPSSATHTVNANGFDFLGSYIAPAIGAGLNTTTNYTYNNDKKLTSITRPDGNTVTLTYSPTTGNLTTLTDPDGNFTYSITGGQVMSSSSTDGIKDTFTWNGYLPATDTVKLGSTTIGKVISNWNSFLTLDSLVVTDSTNASYTASYSYDNDGILVTAGDEALSPDSTTGLLDSTTLGTLSDSYSYDASYAELSAYSASYTPSGGSPSTLLSETYTTRDALGRISAKSETTNGTTHTYGYTYDTAGRLTAVTRDGSAYSSYSYDSNSNRATGSSVAGTSVTASYDAQDRLSSYNTLTFGYDLNGQRTSMTDSSTSQTTSYTWDELGNLKSVTLPSSTVISYLVDGSGRRVVRKSGSTVTAQYVYRDNLKIEAVLDSSGTLVQRFVYGSKPNVPDYMVMGGTDYRIFSDERGSVRLVVNSTDGTILEQMDYDEFGNVINDTSPGAQPFGFAGCLYDTSTKLCHFGAREYDAGTGRWLSKDPLLFGGGDTNLYGYVLQDPINGIDPTGLLFQNIIAHWTTPEQQAFFSAGLISAGLYLGGAFLRSIPAADTPLTQTLTGLAGLGSLFLLNEGIQNGNTAVNRLLGSTPVSSGDINQLINPSQSPVCKM